MVGASRWLGMKMTSKQQARWIPISPTTIQKTALPLVCQPPCWRRRASSSSTRQPDRAKPKRRSTPVSCADAVRRQRQVAHSGHADDGERLVDFVEPDIGRRPTDGPSSVLIAAIGAVVKSAGACATPATPAILAKGLSWRRAAWLCRINTRAAAPSEMELELAGVTVPPSRNAGLSLGILAGSAVNGCSSLHHLRFRPCALSR